ncbi:hypothetical protein CFAM422_008382 [Trichoderma lentiforme]|uniref:Uncharacterized protein n=1 Tax=Trichoderma lentiforme TaxID=1567552 RepID=A0A9P4XC59_9HYPO|nr:hypothetical protein CFAM422_008382 [Trichoderma lentiforme]
MSILSTRALNGSHVTSSEEGTMTGNTVDDRNPSSYSLDRFLSDMDRNHPPGYGQAQSPAESKRRIQQILRNFDANFPSTSDYRQPSDSPQPSSAS